MYNLQAMAMTGDSQHYPGDDLTNYFNLLHVSQASPSDGMNFEKLRLGSFKHLPQSCQISAIKLAKAGFHYSGHDDEVNCHWCDLKVKDWQPDYDPVKVHQEFGRECPFLKNNVQDIPFGRKLKPEPELPDCGYKEMSSTPTAGTMPATFTEIKDLGPPSNDDIKSSETITNEKISAITNDYSELATQPDYRCERDRLSSYIHWPSNASVKPEDLARTGLFYMGTDDRVQCFSCRGILRNWEEGDFPDSEHRRHFGQCPFLLDPATSGNIGLGAMAQSPGAQTQNQRQSPEFVDCPVDGAVVNDSVAHPEYSTPAQRLKSFQGFPSDKIQTPEQFAKAGFYYEGTADHVKCYMCDGGLRNWEPNDDPWTEHARWFPKCQHIRLIKGEEFINHIQNTYTPPQNKPPPRMRNISKGKKHPVNRRKVHQYLTGHLATAVIDMGYDRDSVRNAIVQRMEELDSDDYFPNVESLVDSVEEYEQYQKYIQQHPELLEQQSEQLLVDQQSEQLLADQQLELESPDTEAANDKKRKKKKKKKGKKPDTSDISVTMTTERDLEDHQQINEQAPAENNEYEQVTAESMTNDIARLKDERRCKICLDSEVNIVFLKCGHLVCCSNCSPSLRICPICRAPIRGTIKVFLS